MLLFNLICISGFRYRFLIGKFNIQDGDTFLFLLSNRLHPWASLFALVLPVLLDPHASEHFRHILGSLGHGGIGGSGDALLLAGFNVAAIVGRQLLVDNL